MRIPIAHTLAWPERMETPCERLDLVTVSRLDFEEPALERFPALGVAKAVLREGVARPALPHAANGIAVAFFMAFRPAFPANAKLAHDTLPHLNSPSTTPT